MSEADEEELQTTSATDGEAAIPRAADHYAQAEGVANVQQPTLGIRQQFAPMPVDEMTGRTHRAEHTEKFSQDAAEAMNHR